MRSGYNRGIFNCTSMVTNKEFIVKVCSNDALAIKQAINEAKIYSKLEPHPNILGFEDFFVDTAALKS